MTRMIILTGLLAAACQQQEPAAPAEAQSDVTVPREAAAASASAGCASGWTVRVDRASLIDGSGRKPFEDQRLAAFEQSIGTAVRQAVDAACEAGEVEAEAARAIRTVSVSNDPERDTPKFYADEKDRTLTTLADAFVVRDLAVPSEMELRQGMQCLTDMNSKVCLDSFQ